MTKITTDASQCEHFKATVTDVPAGAKVRFQLGHDLVKFVQTSEQDTAAAFDSGQFPASDWGFSVRVNDQEVLDRIVTVQPCTNALPFTGTNPVPYISLGLSLILLGLVVLAFVARRTHHG